MIIKEDCSKPILDFRYLKINTQQKFCKMFLFGNLGNTCLETESPSICFANFKIM